MKKITAQLFLIGVVSLSNSSLFAYPLTNNVNVVKPNEQSRTLYNENKTKLFVLTDFSDEAMHNLLLNLKQEVGRDKNKQIHIFWSNKASKESAVKIQRVLLAEHMKQKNITLHKSTNNEVYPLYVEVKHMQPRTVNCHSGVVGSDDDRFGCAVNHNQHVELDR